MYTPRQQYRSALPLALLLAAAGAVPAAFAGTESGTKTATGTPAEAQPDASSAAKPLSLISAEDGHLDVSEFVDQAYGFIPLLVPITEPAVGAGAAGALAFIDKSNQKVGNVQRPNISVLGGFATENGTQGVIAGDMRYWLDGRLQTMVGGLDATVNLDYYGADEQSALDDNPISYGLDLTGALAQASYRIGRYGWLGLGYLVVDTDAGLNSQTALPITGDTSTTLGGLMISATWDTRDNLFTPRGGSYLMLTNVAFDESLGSDHDFNRASLVGMQYLTLAPDWYMGWREMLVSGSGDTPFYAKPFVYMRGVPAMRYQGDNIAQIETELTWQFHPRYSALAFVGAGAAYREVGEFSRSSDVVAGGAGMRYEIARKYGLHMGMDVAWSPDGGAVYIQFGSAWMRP